MEANPTLPHGAMHCRPRCGPMPIKPKTKKAFKTSIIFLCLALVACGKKETSKDEDTTKITAVVPVRATTIITGSVPLRLIVTGHTEAVAREKLVAQIAGRLLTLKGTEGSYVAVGEPLATIQSKEAQSSEEGARVMLSEAKTPAQRAEAERMIALAKQDQNGVVVRSNIAGLIATRSANPGEFVSEDQELFSIVDPSDIVFVADVPLFQISQVRIGEQASVLLPTLPGGPLSATVFAIKPQADSSSQSGKVVFQFRNLSAQLQHALRIGIAGTAEIVFDVRHNAMLVPKSAVVRDDETDKRTIMTFGSDSIAHSVEIVAGPEIDTLVSIESQELKPGMNIIFEGNYSLADSTRITLNAPRPSADSTETDKSTSGGKSK
jgi:multidrug efflux pump subunit AcrA (membrane-fusion protein)